jgi:hypothetical protein
MTDNPYMAADVDVEVVPRRLAGRKTWLTFGVGTVSLATLVYLSIFYPVMISLQARGQTNRMDAIMSQPFAAATHVAVCLGGGATALWMCVHALRNRQLRLWRRAVVPCR